MVSPSLFWGPARGLGYRGRHHSLSEFAYGLWKSIQVASSQGWGVHVYHDGNVETVLRRFRAAFPPHMLRCIRVQLAPDLQGRRYLGTLYRLLAADDPNVDVWISRDLDDPLDADGLRLTTDQWVLRFPDSGIHWQQERYDTETRNSMVNMGWFGQRNTMQGSQARPSVRATILKHIRGKPLSEVDRYTSDEEFLTDVWIPLMKRTGYAGRIVRLPSWAYRKAAPARRPKAWHQFQRSRLPPATLHQNDPVVFLG